jgi:ribonucleoside-diphosphate reductase alpha chain
MNKFEEVVAASTEYFNGDELAATIFANKYALRDEDNESFLELTPDDMHHRIAKELARIERNKFKKPLKEAEIYNALKGFNRLVPQGGLLFGIGSGKFVTLSNCYFLQPPLDSYGGIHYTDQCITQVSKRRGGTGTDLSHLRPNRAPTNNSSRTSTGPVSFAKRYSHSIREVGQDGRRGALMLMLNVHHPDILEFVESKLDREELTGVNISVKLTDEFLQAVQAGEKYEQRWPVDANKPQVSQMVDATKVWKKIIKCAWDSGEPGLLFWDRILHEALGDCYADEGFATVGTNPCSELPMNINGSCLLMALCAYGYVRDPFTDKAWFDYEAFYNDARLAARLMDDVVDLELEHIDRIIAKIERDPEHDQYKRVELDLWRDIYKRCMDGRRIGIGPTGIGDALAALGIKYGSIKGINRVDRIYETLKFGVFSGSIDIAEELGSFSFYNAKKEQRNPFIMRLKNSELALSNTKKINGKDLHAKMLKFGRRNIGLLTTAPAGTISFLTQTTSGGEPLPYIQYTRKTKINPSDTNARVDFTDVNGDKFQVHKVKHPKVETWMEITGETDIKESPWHGCCAGDLEPKQRVKQQAIAQRHIDHAISSTVNLPKSATQKQIAEIYETAWETGIIKGITVYRDGCRGNVISKQEEEEPSGIPRSEAPERPRILKCDVYHTRVQGQKYFVLVGLLDGDPYEVFAGRDGFLPDKIKSGEIVRKRRGYYIATFDGSDVELSPITAASSEMEEMVTRLASTALRHGADTQFLVHQLEKVGERGDLHNFAIGVARILKKYIKDGSEEKGAVCDECGGGPVVRQQGCPTCTGCGYSRCL